MPISWKFSDEAFNEIRRVIEYWTKWKYSGTVDLVLANALRDGRLIFSNTVCIDLSRAKEQKAIDSVEEFFEKVFQFCESYKGYDPTWDFSDRMGLLVGRSALKEMILSLLPSSRDALVQEIRLNEICQLNLMGNIQLSTQAVQSLCEQRIPICYFSMGGWFYGITTGLLTKNVFLRQRQFTMAGEVWFCRRFARSLVAGKIRNQRTFLLRNHIEPDGKALRKMKEMAERADTCDSMEELLGLEGNAARVYFGAFQGLSRSRTASSCRAFFGWTLPEEIAARRAMPSMRCSRLDIACHQKI
jgi:CRISPR associated protein Cas1